ncbi:MAG: hypothetical protein F6K40_07695 [Okeania sp. SIO3I5]|uniref:hypothetical protein n=1 Tax=Okeania sp. SIO3I5 TaxID=2607805 RepID=UPI0013B87852|nr:hypothetical protein [Okeania sp. SIO3I5]NEQ36175.1 hypothetical protein [Okeania sp. SIO3I5]
MINPSRLGASENVSTISLSAIKGKFADSFSHGGVLQKMYRLFLLTQQKKNLPIHFLTAECFRKCIDYFSIRNKRKICRFIFSRRGASENVSTISLSAIKGKFADSFSHGGVLHKMYRLFLLTQQKKNLPIHFLTAECFRKCLDYFS